LPKKRRFFTQGNKNSGRFSAAYSHFMGIYSELCHVGAGCFISLPLRVSHSVILAGLVGVSVIQKIKIPERRKIGPKPHLLPNTKI
jgi:hypothetical protein